MDNIKVSVIVPVYNGEEYIQTSISSIINQEFSENYEIIVVDDGSDDNSLDIAQEVNLTFHINWFIKEIPV